MSTRIGPLGGGFVPETQALTPRLGAADAVQQVTKPSQEEPEGSRVPTRPEELEALAGHMNEAVAAINHSIRFEVGEGSRIMIRVVDSLTNEVIREIPPESLVKALKHLEKALGLLVDEKR